MLSLESCDTFGLYPMHVFFACTPHIAGTTYNLLGEGVGFILVNLVFTMYNFLEPREIGAIHKGWKITHRVLSLPSVIFAVISSHHILALSANVDICSW